MDSMMEVGGAIIRDQRVQMVGAIIAGGFTLFQVGSYIITSRKRAAFYRIISEGEKDVVQLISFPRKKSGGTMSPPSAKVEFFLRANKIPYVFHEVQDPSLSPTERFPCLGYNGTIVCDSNLIIDYLMEKFNITMDSHLSPVQKAHGLAMARLVDLDLYMHNYRTSVVDNKPFIIQFLKDEMGVPGIIAPFIAGMYRKDVINTLNTIGEGDLSDDQYKAEQLKDFKALEACITGQKFLFGDKITSYDIRVVSMIRDMLGMDVRNAPSIDYFKSNKTLCNYIEAVDIVCQAQSLKEATKDNASQGKPQKFVL